MTATGVVRQLRRWRLRRADGLPLGQRALDEFPRFADNPLRPPPSTSGSTLNITSADLGEIRIPLDEMGSSALAESRVSDFHCVQNPWQTCLSWTCVLPPDRRYLSEGSVVTLYPECDTDVVAELNSGD